MAAAALRQTFLQADQHTARQAWRHLADQFRPRWPRLAALMDESEHEVLAYMAFPAQHRAKLHSTNPLERLNKEVKRRADVVGIFPNEASMTAPTMLPTSGSSGRWSSRAHGFGPATDGVAAWLR
jgi:transposase-like protein